MLTASGTISEEYKLAELLCTRLCHDLTGPIGAVNNGAEFLSEEGFGLPNQAVDLIISSALEAVSRLQFFRMAYGRVNEKGEACLADKKKIAAAFFAHTKITLDWPDSHTDAAGISINARLAQVLLNVLVLSASVLVKGGNIAVRLSRIGHEGKEISIKASGDTIKRDPEMETALLENKVVDDLTPKSAQPYFTRVLTESAGAKLLLNADAASYEIIIRQE